MATTLTAICLSWLLAAQVAEGDRTLFLGKAHEGNVESGAAVVHSPTLDARYTNAPTVGHWFSFLAPSAGTYHFDLHSFAFDGYLVLRDADGVLVSEDDDGWISSHSRIVAELRADTRYQITACALHGARGPYRIEVQAGSPPSLTDDELRAASLSDTVARVAWLEQHHGIKSQKLATALIGLGNQFGSQAKWPEAQVIFKRMLEITEEHFQSDLPRMAASLNFLGLTYQRQGQFEQALGLLERAVPVWEQAFGPINMNTASSKNNLAEVYRNLGRYQEAEPLYLESLDILKKLLGTEHPTYAAFLNNLATLYKNQGRLEEAVTQALRALEIAENAFGPEHVNVVTCLSNLAVIYKQQGRLTEVEPLFQRCLEISERTLGDKHPLVAQRLNNMAMLLDDQGRYSEAIPLSRRAVAINEATLGREHPETGLSLNNLAYLLNKQGHHAQAEPLMERALAIRKKVFGTEHPQYAGRLNNLGMFYLDQGRFADAEPLLLEALAVAEKILGPDHHNLATYVNNLASLYKSQKRYGDAERLYTRSLEIREKSLSASHPSMADSLDNLAKLAHFQGLLERAEANYLRALSIRETALGDSHPDVAGHLNNLAKLYGQKGEFRKALPYAQRAVQIWKDAHGTHHPYFVGGLSGLAEIHSKLDQWPLALEQFQFALQSLLEYLDRELPTLSESDRFQLLSRGQGPGSLLQAALNTKTADLAFTYHLFLQWKGKLTRLQAANLALTQGMQHPDTRKHIGALQGFQKQLSSLVFLPLTMQEDDHAERVAELRRQRLQVERELNRSLQLDHLLQAPALSELQSAIPSGAVLIDFFVGKSVYAWVLHADGKPQLFDLGDAQTMREAQQAYLVKTVSRGGRVLNNNQSDNSASLVKLLWHPLAEQIEGAETILISPDGFLCELPFGMLRTAPDQFLLQSHRFVYLTDATALMAEGNAEVDREGSMLAVGDVNYYRADAVSKADPSSEPSTSRQDRAKVEVEVEVERARIGDKWTSLSATRMEVETIRDIREYVMEWKADFTQLGGTAATEENVRQSIPGQRYVHIATHGFFEPDHLPSLLRDADEKQAEERLGAQIQAVGLLPGLLSGLVFAGVNSEAKTNREDGYLSAEEIQYLDLSACDLAVLSACETALGSRRAGEGLMSLRRAFEVAGAKTVVSSLWKVDDRATADLMAQFYQNYWEKSMSKSEALHQAKLRLLRQNRADFGGEAKPETWGAFVLSGAWN